MFSLVVAIGDVGQDRLDVLPGKADLEAEGLLTDVLPDGFTEEGIEVPEGGEDDVVDEITEDMTDETSFMTDFLDEEEDGGPSDEVEIEDEDEA